jgi:hypothetical protein
MRRIYNLVGNSRVGDINHNRYDKRNHITTRYLLQLKKTNGDKCCHCGCELDWSDQQHIRRKQQVTLQRLDNSIGHVIGNCAYACFECNVIKRRENIEKMLSKFEKDRVYSYEEIRVRLAGDGSVMG